MKREILGKLVAALIWLSFVAFGSWMCPNKADAQSDVSISTILASTECVNASKTRRGKVIAGHAWNYEIRSVSRSEVRIYGLLNDCYLAVSSGTSTVSYIDHGNDRFALAEVGEIERKYSRKIATILREAKQRCRRNPDAYFLANQAWKRHLELPPPDTENAPDDTAAMDVCSLLVFQGFSFEVFAAGEERLAVIILSGVATTFEAE